METALPNVEAGNVELDTESLSKEVVLENFPSKVKGILRRSGLRYLLRIEHVLHNVLLGICLQL